MQVAGGMISSPSQLVPAEIKRELDKDVIGQERAKKILSVALHSHIIRVHKAEQATAEQSKRAGSQVKLYKLSGIHSSPFICEPETSHQRSSQQREYCGEFMTPTFICKQHQVYMASRTCALLHAGRFPSVEIKMLQQ
jgi:hypothetical protein